MSIHLLSKPYRMSISIPKRSLTAFGLQYRLGTDGITKTAWYMKNGELTLVDKQPCEYLLKEEHSVLVNRAEQYAITRWPGGSTTTDLRKLKNIVCGADAENNMIGGCMCVSSLVAGGEYIILNPTEKYNIEGKWEVDFSVLKSSGRIKDFTITIKNVENGEMLTRRYKDTK